MFFFQNLVQRAFRIRETVPNIITTFSVSYLCGLSPIRQDELKLDHRTGPRNRALSRAHAEII